MTSCRAICSGCSSDCDTQQIREGFEGRRYEQIQAPGSDIQRDGRGVDVVGDDVLRQCGCGATSPKFARPLKKMNNILFIILFISHLRKRSAYYYTIIYILLFWGYGIEKNNNARRR